MNQDDRDTLIEAAATAFRERAGSGRIVPSPAWRDLSPDDRDAAFALQWSSRVVERAIDPSGLSTTARLVLSKLRTLRQIER